MGDYDDENSSADLSTMENGGAATSKKVSILAPASKRVSTRSRKRSFMYRISQNFWSQDPECQNLCIDGLDTAVEPARSATSVNCRNVLCLGVYLATITLTTIYI